MSLYEQLLKTSLESQLSEDYSPKRDSQPGLAQQTDVPIEIVSDLVGANFDTSSSLSVVLESKGFTTKVTHTDVYTAEAGNSSNGIETVVRKIAPPSGKGGAVAKMDMMEYRTVRIVRPWDLQDALDAQALLYVEDEELAEHLSEEGYQVARTMDEVVAHFS